MTKEEIQERLKTLEAERDQVRATALAYEGAIQDCNWWLNKLSEDSKKEETN